MELNDLSDQVIDAAYLTVLDIFLKIEKAGVIGQVTLDPSFAHGSKLIPLGKFNLDLRTIAINKLSRLYVFSEDAFHEGTGIGHVSFDAIYSLWSFRPIVDKLDTLQSGLQSIRSKRGLGPVEGPLAPNKIAPNKKASYFKQSDNFHSVKWGRKEFLLNDRQAEVIQLLYDRAKKHPNSPWLYQKRILRTVTGKDINYGGSLRDIFKSRQSAWDTLVFKHPTAKARVRFPTVPQPSNS